MGNKKVLVIGAGSYSQKHPQIKGIGTCLIERLAKEDNFSVLFTYYQSQEGAEKLAKNIRSERPSFEIDYLRFNSLNYKLDWENLESRLTEFGTPDIFVYNAGLRFYKKNITEDEKEATMRVNYYCPVFLMEKIEEMMYREGIKGKIVLTGSVLAGKHHPFLEDYCLSKGLLEKYVQEKTGYWKSRGIEIGIVSPSLTRTPMVEEQIDFYEEEIKQGKRPKIVSPEKIAEEITNLCL